jgi:NADPH:quinone reductase-like Zn-dependent oxidoreductase
MKKVLITGATGNVGMAVIKSLDSLPNNLQIIAGIRDFNSDKQKLASYKIDFIPQPINLH